MTVFLGDRGRIMLRRHGSDLVFRTLVNEADVNPEARRFAVDYSHEQLITGDLVEISTVDGTDLNWIEDDDADDSITRYVHVDAAGGIRLFKTFSASIEGCFSQAIQLNKPVLDQLCAIQIKAGKEDRCLAEVSSYQITTSRETIDTTNLGNHYRKQYEAGLIQGQGQIECFWSDVSSYECQEDKEFDGNMEFTSFLAQLCIRLVHGAAFHGLFYIYADEDNNKRSVWYESESCIVTNVAITVSPTEVITATIDFITSGPIALREGYIPQFLELEEISDDVDLEGDGDEGGTIELDGILGPEC